MEPGETPEAAMRREVLEETAVVVGEARLFAHQHLHSDDPVPDGFRHPHPDAYTVFFMGEVERLEAFAPTPESSDCRLWAPDEAAGAEWVRRHRPVYDAVLQERRSAAGRSGVNERAHEQVFV